MRSPAFNSRSTSRVPSTTTRTHTRRSAVISERGASGATGFGVELDGAVDRGTGVARPPAGRAPALDEPSGLAFQVRVNSVTTVIRTAAPPATAIKSVRPLRRSADSDERLTAVTTVGGREDSSVNGAGSEDETARSVALAVGIVTDVIGAAGAVADVSTVGVCAEGRSDATVAVWRAARALISGPVSRSDGGVRNPRTNRSKSAWTSLRRRRHSSIPRFRRSNSSSAAPSSQGTPCS